jgi:short-subunit dehydrogenase
VVKGRLPRHYQLEVIVQIANKVFAVTGGGAGIGREVVFEILRRGGKVAALDLNEAGLAETASMAGDNAKHLTTHVVNIADRAAVAALPAAIIKAHGQIDSLINVAGIIHHFKRVNDLDCTESEKVMNVNLGGPLNLVKAFLPELLKRPEAHVSLVSSMGGYAPVPGQTIYGATKAAVKLLGEGLHSELMDTNVGVTVVFPGAIATNIAVNSGIMTQADAAKMAEGGSSFKSTPAPLAGKLIVDGIVKKSYHVFIGQDAKTMDVLTRLMPERAAAMIFKQMKSLLG